MSSSVQTPEHFESAHLFLNEAYRSLGFQEGALLKATNRPDSAEDWLEKGDWLNLAKIVGAEAVFFVNNDPVVVFCEFKNTPDVEEQINTFRRVWCMARPQCLFMALPGELRVYSLNQPPAKNSIEWQNIRPLDIVRRVTDVAEKLQDYRREEIESGRLFADGRFGDIGQRSDRRLIQDLKTIRRLLIKMGLDKENVRYAHSLIGRSIFIRYLEDRGILTPAYFTNIATGNSDWGKILLDSEQLDLTLNLENRRYDRVLRNKEFTYALFKQLTIDFNGDMFPDDGIEEKVIRQEHLNLLRFFLLGDADPLQPSLFFWAYDFKIIPIELISSIYEEFYHGSNVEDDKGTHYTPSTLVDFVISRVLTNEKLASHPRILDPACGSGIFLVEAFRRIVRYQVQQKGRFLSSEELRQILRSQIRGIEINEEAIHIAAFSLYLALLHYQEPPDIMANKRLPNLIYNEEHQEDEFHIDLLFKNNTFALLDVEREGLEGILAISPRFKGRAQVKKLLNLSPILPLAAHSFDIVVGNPPWGFEEGTTPEMQEAQELAQKWCEVFSWSIGDKEFSQAFIARILSLLRPTGESGLLVSTGIFFKHHEKSQKFRSRWLEESTINTVVNFAHVRHAFFTADAPFAFIHFGAAPPHQNHQMHYWSIRKTELIDHTQSILLSYADLKQVRQDDLKRNDILWKVYWWGSHRDAVLIEELSFNMTLKQLALERSWPEPGRGFQGFRPAADNYPSTWLKEYKELPTRYFRRYGLINESDLRHSPDVIHRRGDRDIYSGWRLLVKRGITQAEGVNGQIEARLDSLSYCFRNSIHGINLADTKDLERKILIGILWSSLARYYFFMTASSWGTWHHEVHLEEVISMPVRFTDNLQLQEKIGSIVDQLRYLKSDFWGFEGSKVAELERELDEAIFDLYKLMDAERDLVREMCEFGLDYFYNHTKSMAAKTVYRLTSLSQGTIEDLPIDSRQGLESYIRIFLEVWNRDLEPDGEFRWRIVSPKHAAMIGVVFTTQEKKSPLPHMPLDEEQEWASILKRCEKALSRPVSQSVYIDCLIRAVTDTDIFIIKRNERRLWTRSAAREDAEATILQAMHLQGEHANYL